jgi:polyisoprenoid-binding protein YceI
MFKTIFSASALLTRALVLSVAWMGLAQADSYTLDKGHTLVSFAWERAGLSRQQGRFTDANGSVAFDPAKPEDSTIDVTVRASSLQTGVEALDRHLRSADFFDVAQHPVITFKSTSVTKTSDKKGELVGDLTMLGVTKPVKLQVSWIYTGPHPLGQINPALRDRTVSVFSATGTIKRSDWGITRVIPLVSDDIQLTIETELLKK